MTLSELEDISDYWTLEFDLGSPIDATVRELGFEPTGYFWDSLVDYAAPDLAAAVESDSEMAAYVAFGDRDALLAVQVVLESLVSDAAKVTALVAQARADDHELDN